jgi:hypothetical protein
MSEDNKIYFSLSVFVTTRCERKIKRGILAVNYSYTLQ